MNPSPVGTWPLAGLVTPVRREGFVFSLVPRSPVSRRVVRTLSTPPLHSCDHAAILFPFARFGRSLEGGSPRPTSADAPRRPVPTHEAARATRRIVLSLCFLLLLPTCGGDEYGTIGAHLRACTHTHTHTPSWDIPQIFFSQKFFVVMQRLCALLVARHR